MNSRGSVCASSVGGASSSCDLGLGFWDLRFGVHGFGRAKGGFEVFEDWGSFAFWVRASGFMIQLLGFPGFDFSFGFSFRGVGCPKSRSTAWGSKNSAAKK